jgi:hypothetical protein
VNVFKDNNTSPVKTIITSRGYNTGDASCNSTGSNSVEREIKVTYGGGSSLPITNISQGKNATQSSTVFGGNAGRAVDSVTDGNWGNSSVTHTNSEANAWWQADLGSSFLVDSLTVWNRTDCCGDRLSDYWVFISDTPFLPSDTSASLLIRVNTWNNHQISPPNPSTNITGIGVRGQYVRVQLSGTNYLSLAEVEIFGSP